MKTLLSHTTSDFSVEDEQESISKEHIRRLVARLNSPEGKASMAAAAEETRKRIAKLEQDCRITDPLFMLQRVTI